MKQLLERDIERYLVKRVKELGGEVRKVQWVGRRGAPDRLVMLPKIQRGIHIHPARARWVEVKNPDTLKTFPSDPRERAQAREHERMRAMGQVVVVVGTYEGVDALLA